MSTEYMGRIKYLVENQSGSDSYGNGSDIIRYPTNILSLYGFYKCYQNSLRLLQKIFDTLSALESCHVTIFGGLGSKKFTIFQGYHFGDFFKIGRLSFGQKEIKHVVP